MDILRNRRIEICAAAGLLLAGAIVGIIYHRKKLKCLREKEVCTKQSEARNTPLSQYKGSDMSSFTADLEI